MSNFVKEIGHFLSADGVSNVAAFYYTPANGHPKAAIQLSHGMCEYICRYEPMFEVLAGAGYAIFGNDHLGHGDTSPGNYGFMAEQEGYKYVLEDLSTMNRLGHEKFPGIPCFLLGHSMGSFYARWFAELHPEAIDGLILSGTGGPSPLMPVGKVISALLSKLRGPKYISKFMVDVSMGSYCKGIESEGSGNAWLSRDPSVWEKYAADPKCSFSFTVSAYRDMLTAYIHVNKKPWANGINKDMPIYIYSGDKDPVGAYGKGVQTVYQMLKTAGILDLQLKLYPGGRHEMHNETNKDEVFGDLIRWLDIHI